VENVLFLSSGHAGDQCVKLLLEHALSGFTHIQVVHALPQDFDPRSVSEEEMPDYAQMETPPVSVIFLFSYATKAMENEEEERLRRIIYRVRGMYGEVAVLIVAGYASEIDTFQELNEPSVTIESVEESGLTILHKLYTWVLTHSQTNG
jgi:hypothetical protein